MFWLVSLVMLAAPWPPAPITAILTLSLGASLRAAAKAGWARPAATAPAALTISPRRVSPPLRYAAMVDLPCPVRCRNWPIVRPDWQGQERPDLGSATSGAGRRACCRRG